jgi:hypothetical protein
VRHRRYLCFLELLWSVVLLWVAIPGVESIFSRCNWGMLVGWLYSVTSRTRPFNSRRVSNLSYSFKKFHQKFIVYHKSWCEPGGEPGGTRSGRLAEYFTQTCNPAEMWSIPKVPSSSLSHQKHDYISHDSSRDRVQVTDSSATSQQSRISKKRRKLSRSRYLLKFALLTIDFATFRTT